MPPTLLVKGSLRGHPGAVPVAVITDWLKARMPEYGGAPPATLKDRVLIAKSETGSGKSTVLPVHVFRLLRSERAPPQQAYAGRSVLCTQPRVLTAMTLARDMAAAPYYPDLVLPGDIVGGKAMRGVVGFQTGPITNKPQRGLIYSTAGVLLAQLQAAAMAGDFAPISDMYAFIIIDEAHERSLDTDRVLMLLKEYLRHGIAQGGLAAQRLPFVILASATINVEAYARFFGLVDDDAGGGATAGMPSASNYFHVVGRQHGIETVWPETGVNDYAAAAAARAISVHTDNPGDPPDQRDVLVFMPGAAESLGVARAVEKARDGGALDAGGPVVVLTIDREAVNTENAAFVLVKAPAEALWGVLERNELYPAARLADMRARGLHARRIIVSTVVAETGLTIETLKYVIDAGWNRAREAYQPYNAAGLITRPAAASRVQQRKGRAGRLFPGVFYPLYTESVYNALPPQQMPDIVTSGAGPLILTMALSQRFSTGGRDEFRLERVDMLDPPPADALAAALDQAVGLGFLSPHVPIQRLVAHDAGAAPTGDQVGVGYGLTALGEHAVRFPRLELPEIRLLLAAPLWDAAVSDLATIVAAVQVCGARGLAGLLDRDAAREAKTPDAARRLLDAAFVAGLPAGYAGGGAPPLAMQADWGRAIVQDDLIEALCVFEAFRARLDAALAAHPDTFHAAVEEWCAARNLSAAALVGVARAREAVLTEMVAAGLNPFWGSAFRLARAPADAMLARVQALKRCIYDAYRLNELAAAGDAYRDRFGLRVAAHPVRRAAALVSPQLTIVAAKKAPGQRRAPMRWTVAAPMVSALDTGVAATAVAPQPELIDPEQSAPL